jgi:hypothetical protein
MISYNITTIVNEIKYNIRLFKIKASTIEDCYKKRIILICMSILFCVIIGQDITSKVLQHIEYQRVLSDFTKPPALMVDAFTIAEHNIKYTQSEHLTDVSIFADAPQLEYRQPLYIDMAEYNSVFDRFNAPEHLRGISVQLATEYQIDPKIVIGLFQIESLWSNHPNYITTYDNRRNRNGTFDIGMGQLNTQYHDYFEKKHFDPQVLDKYGYYADTFDVYNDIQNMQVSLSYLRYLIDYFKGSVHKALMAYNCGMGNVQYNNIPISTKKYSVAIQKNLKSVYLVELTDI